MNFTLEENLKEKWEKRNVNYPPEDEYSEYSLCSSASKGLGDAILQAAPFVGDEPFVVLLGDDIMPNDIPLTKLLMDTYNEKTGRRSCRYYADTEQLGEQIRYH